MASRRDREKAMAAMDESQFKVFCGKYGGAPVRHDRETADEYQQRAIQQYIDDTNRNPLHGEQLDIRLELPTNAEIDDSRQNAQTDAAKRSADSAERSADSAERSASASERSATVAERADRRAWRSLFVSGIAVFISIITLAVSLLGWMP